MENNYLNSISAMFSIVEPTNSESTQEIITDFYKHLDSISNKKQLSFLKQLVKVCYESPETQDDKKQILNEIRQRIEQIFSSHNQNPNLFLNDMFNKNKKKVGVSILHNDGSFILTDHMTRKILEIKPVTEIQERLFNYCAIAGLTNLQKQFNEEANLLQQNELEKQFSMTIYSEKIRKNAIKYLNQTFKKTVESLENQSIPPIKLQRLNIQQQNFDYWDKIKIKYLKTITIKITKVKMSVNEEFLNQIQNSTLIYGSHLLQTMAENPTQQYNVVKCEISENPQIEEILHEDILKDDNLSIYEEKWKKKCQAIREKFQSLKNSKEQTKIENQFQHLPNSSQVQYDSNSHIQPQWMYQPEDFIT